VIGVWEHIYFLDDIGQIEEESDELGDVTEE